MLPIASRQYYCPVCDHREKHSTNHVGEIYCHCRRCGNSPLYCAEADAHAGLPYREAVLRCYRYDISDPAYKALLAQLSGVECFRASCEYRSLEALRRHDGETVRLYEPDQWPDQFVSNIGRLHRWFEAVCPNWRVKTGYYLA